MKRKIPDTKDTKDTAECDFVAYKIFRNFALSLREMAAQPVYAPWSSKAKTMGLRGEDHELRARSP